MSVFSMAGSNPALPTYPLQRSVRLRSSASAYFNRTPATTTSQTIFTFSAWVKLGNITGSRIYVGRTGANFPAFGIAIGSTGITTDQYTTGGATQFLLATTQVFRDPSAWYHLVFAYDTTQATAANRVKIYVNGIQVTAFNTATYPAQNLALNVNTTNTQIIGADIQNGGYFDGYLEEINFIDGQALTPSSFGAYNSYGVWSPAKYTGSYGTNGFYLNFQDNSALTTTANVGIGKDSSGNGNYWTSNNISLTAGATYDSMLDVPTNTSPTNANYAVLNPLIPGIGVGNSTLSNANLTATSTAGGSWPEGAYSSIRVSSGKWYCEITPSSGTAIVGAMIGVASASTSYWYYSFNGNKYTYTTNSGAYGASYTDNDVIGIALDLDAGTLTFYKNGASQGTAFSGLTGEWVFCVGDASGGATSLVANANFGQRPFSYTPPTGFNRLNTYNLPDSIVPVGAQYMAATTYTGTGAARSVANTVNGTSFQPDFVWIKDRSVASAHALTNAVTGITKYLESNTTAAETTDTTSVTALSSTGFSLGAGTSIYYTNRNGEAFVAWQWRASNASAVTNTAGSRTSQVSANQTAGFSIVTYNGNGTAGATVGHGLGVVPSWIILKNTSSTQAWTVGTAQPGGWDRYMTLNSSAAATLDGTVWNTTNPTSSVFTLGTSLRVNGNGGSYVAYCWTPVPGYSAFGSYTGNGSTDGPFVYLGFRPRWLMIKKTDTTSDWWIWDTSRNTYNQMQSVLYADLSDAEFTGSVFNFDALSNGFKNRSSNVTVNGSGATYIYAAFAENPFKNSLAR
jgi:hypothetical protein